MRTFLALPLPPAATGAIEALQSDLPAGRAVPAENLHLTLAFLGDRTEAELEAAHEALLTLRARAFTLRLTGLGTLGGRSPALLHLSAEADPALTDLHGRIRSRLHGAGLMLPRERFLPHVTIARFGHRLGVAEQRRLGDFIAARHDFRIDPFPVTGFTLFHSTLDAPAPVYEVLAHYPLS